MKKISRILSIITAFVLIISVCQIPVSALKLTGVGYTFPGAAEITRDTEGGTEPIADAYFDTTTKYSGDYALKMKSEAGPTANKEFRVNLKMIKMEKNADYKLAFMLKAADMNGLNFTITNQ